MSERIITEVDGRPLTLSNLDRPLFPTGFTKSELISYYLEIAEVLLPHVCERAVTRVRFPQGTNGASFFEKNAPAGAPPWVRTAEVASDSGTVNYVTVADRATLAWLANIAAIELHAPQWRFCDSTSGPTGAVLEGPKEPRATTLIVDLDPGPGITPKDCAKAAIIAATTLTELGLEPQVKLSGNKGLQLSAPLQPTPASAVFTFARSLANHLSDRHPSLFVATMSKQDRGGRVFVDYAQNLAARNTVVAYSVRGLRQPSVAVPLSWEEVASFQEGPMPSVTPAEALSRVQRFGDLWLPMLPYGQGPVLPEPIA